MAPLCQIENTKFVTFQSRLFNFSPSPFRTKREMIRKTFFLLVFLICFLSFQTSSLSSLAPFETRDIGNNFAPSSITTHVELNIRNIRLLSLPFSLSLSLSLSLGESVRAAAFSRGFERGATTLGMTTFSRMAFSNMTLNSLFALLNIKVS
jgi:hypothetical protein